MLEAGQENSEVVSPLPLLHVGIGDHLLDVEIDGGVIYRDDLIGQILDPNLVREARQKELDCLNSKNVGFESFRGSATQERQAPSHSQMGARQQG